MNLQNFAVMINTYAFLREGKFHELIVKCGFNKPTEKLWMQLKQLGSFLWILTIFSYQRLPVFGYLPLINTKLSHLHYPSTYPFPKITALKHQNLPVLQNIYHTGTIVLKVTSQNLLYWLASQTIRCLAGWVPVRLLLASPELLVCFMVEHIYKFGSFYSGYPIATFKYYIRYGLEANQGIFSHGALLKKRTKSWALHTLSVLDGSQHSSAQQR